TLAYQWRQNGNAISGATNTIYTIPSIVSSDAGSYDVVVSNPCGLVTSNPVTLTLRAPVAVNDSYATAEDTTLTVITPGVLANDSDVEGDPLSAVLVSSPTHGTLTLNSDGSFTYTPALNYNGPDSFTYKANDGQVDSPTNATVSITVTPVNDAPGTSGGVL